jgi:hypothetical protein
MVLTKEDRIELLKKAREAKANKRAIKEETEDEVIVNVEPPVVQPETPKVKKTRKKNEIAPLPAPVYVVQESESEEEVIEVPIPAPKKKSLPAKWLKKAPEPQKCCDEKVCKEEPLIDDKPQFVAETIVVPSKSTIKKPKAVRASTRTLTIPPEPEPIAELIKDLEQSDMKYRPKQVRQSPAPPSAPIQIVRVEPSLRLFDY